MKPGMHYAVTPREQELLNMLEVKRRTRERITITGFALEAGYANKSALRHFPILKKELADYVEQFTPHAGARGRTSSVRSLEVQVERLGRELGRREEELKRIPILEGKAAILEQEKTILQAEKSTLRGMLSTLLAFITENNIESAMLIEGRLVALATALISGDDSEASEDDLIPDTVERIRPHLVNQKG
ncbi:MAG: hypothetical protein LC795_03845 [Acidobacteria bacterium]|nr:hypothetical protein [Acidobacteriota bacterium]